MGTHLEQYLHKLIECGYKNTKIPNFPFHLWDNDPELTKFYNALPLECSLTKAERLLADSLPTWTWNIKWTHQPIEWKENKDSYITYHVLLRSVSQRVIRKALEDIGYEKHVDYPVIHYRLGDVPFVRNMGHHLNKYAFFLWALDKADINERDDNIVLVVYSNRHRSNDVLKTASYYYLIDFISFLCEQGYNPKIQSSSVLDDFATMVYAPVTISSGSSYSFMAGLATTGLFFSSSVGRESDLIFYTIENCEWMCPHYPLLHGEVENYFDFKTVFEQVRKPFEIHD